MGLDVLDAIDGRRVVNERGAKAQCLLKKRLDDLSALGDRHVVADQARVDPQHIPLRVHLYDLGTVYDSRSVVDRCATHEQIHARPDGLASLRERRVFVDRA